MTGDDLAARPAPCEERALFGEHAAGNSAHANDEASQTQTPPNYGIQQRNYKRPRESPGADFESFKEEMRQMIRELLKPQEKELQSLNITLLEIKESNNKIESSISMLTAETEELKKKVEKLEADKKEDREYIRLLEDKVENLQRDSRKSHLEIKNVPKMEKETVSDLTRMVVQLSETVGSDIKSSDVADVYRVRSKQADKQNSPIIVELTSTILKTDLLKKCKSHNVKNENDKLCAKHLGFKKNENCPVFVSEQLTPAAARLRFLARDLAKSKNYTFCWTSFGRVYVRKNTNSRVIEIKSESQVQRLFQET